MEKRVSKEIVERVTLSYSPALADIRAMRDLCEAVLDGREALEAGTRWLADPQQVALRRILSLLEET